MSIRIYKDNIRENIFRSLLFTDIVLFSLSGVLIAIIVYALFFLASPRINWAYFLGTLGFVEISLYAFALIRVDNQPIYKIIARLIPFTFCKKRLRANKIDTYFREFTIQDGLIVRKKNIAKLFAIQPFDISAINSNERQTFFANVKLALHTLPSRLQIIARKEIAGNSDFTDHFFHLYKSIKKGDKRRERMIENYQKDLTSFIQNEHALTMKYYGVFSIKADTAIPKEKVNAIGMVTDMYTRLTTALESCNVKTRELTNPEIEKHIEKTLR